MVEKFKPRVMSQQIGSRTPGPGGDVQRAAADVLGNVGRIAGKMADEAAATEGARAGTAAGMQEGFQPRRDNTIYGRAFDQAALRTAASQLDTKIQGELAALYTETKHDPIAFNKGVDKIRQDNIRTLPLELQPQYIDSLNRQRFSYDQDIARTRAKLTMDEDAAVAQNWRTAQQADFGRQAYMIGEGDEGSAVLQTGAATYADNLASRYGPKEAFTFEGKEYAADPGRAGIMSLEAIALDVQELKENGAVNRVKGAFDRLEGLQAKTQFLQKFREDYGAGEGLPKEMQLQSVEKLESWMEGEVRELLAEARAREAEARAEIADIRSNLSDYRGFAAQGLKPPPGVMADLRTRARATGNPQIAREVDNVIRLGELTGQAAKASPMQLAGAIASRRAYAEKNGATPEEAAEIAALESTLNGMTTALQRDPMTYAQRAGVIELQPLEFVTDSATGQVALTPQSLALRRKQSLEVSARYGAPFMPFTEQEAQAFSNLEKSDPASLAVIAQQLVSQNGSDATQALAQLSPKAPMLAHMGGLLAQGSSPATVTDIARGQQMLSEAKGVATGLGADADERARTILTPLNGLPETRAQIQRSADALYVARKGLNAPWDQQAYDRAVQEAAGASYTKNGERYGGIVSAGQTGGWFSPQRGTVIAPNWMRADKMPAAAASLSLDDYWVAGGNFAPVDETGEPLPLSTLQTARWVTLGPGVYELKLMQDGEEVDVATKNPAAPGGVYVLDMNKLQHRLRGWK